VTLSPDGVSRTTIHEDSFTDVLDRLAPAYDYALIRGFTRLRLPTVVTGPLPDAAVPSGAVPSDAVPSDTVSTDDAPGEGGDTTATSSEVVPGDVVARFDGEDATLTADRLVSLVEDVEPHVTLETLVERVKQSEGADRSGAIATFTGRVRARDSPEDDRTTHLAFEKYEGVAADRLARIERELTDREGVFEVATHHRVGVIPDGEDIVFVVVLAGHREEAFQTVSDGIDRLKEEVPIFKKESTVAEEFWVHEQDD
jgi:molybdopterin synthase catalytic subunit